MRDYLLLNISTLIVFIITACAPKSIPATTQSSITEAPEAFTETPTPIPPHTNTFTPTTDPAPKPTQMMTSEKDSMFLLYVPAGEFTMGSDIGLNDEKPVHTVYLDAFWIDQTEVTNHMFADFLNQQGNQTESVEEWFDAEEGGVRIHLKENGWDVDSGYEDHPVIAVSWYGADSYCSWVDRRLPTEAEWEKAARGTDERNYPWGNDPPEGNLLNFKQQVGGPTEVGSYPIGVSPYGALDMAGNAVEWVNDWYEGAYYEDSPASNPLGPSDGRVRVLRGGSWAAPVYAARTTKRVGGDPRLTLNDFGFRCAVDAE